MKIKFSDDMDILPQREVMKSKKLPRSYSDKSKAFRVSVRRVEGNMR